MKKTESQLSLNSDDEENQNGDGLTPEGFHPIACIQCRQLHKKCDKKLPECTKCSARGLKCTYNTPRKRGKGSDAYPTKTERRKKSNTTDKSINASSSIMDTNNNPIMNASLNNFNFNLNNSSNNNNNSFASSTNYNPYSNNNTSPNNHQQNPSSTQPHHHHVTMNTTSSNNNNNGIHHHHSNSSSGIHHHNVHGGNGHHSSSASGSTVSPISPMNVVELYYTFLCSGHPMLKRSKFEFFVQTCLQQFLNGPSPPTMIIIPPNNEFIHTEGEMKCLYAFYLSALALSEQITANLPSAQLTAHRCELEIAKLSIDYFSHLYFVGACHNMGAYFIGHGDLQRSRYYFMFGTFYLSENQIRALDVYEKNLEKHRAFVSQGAEQHSPNEFAIFIKGLPKILETSLDKKIEEILLPGTWDYLKSANVTSENFMLFKQVIEAGFNAVSSYRQSLIKKMVDCHSETFFKSQHLHSFIIVEGFKLLFLSRIPDISLGAVEEIALKITLMTEHELFPYCLCTTLASITTTCQYHLDICKMIERGLRPRVSSITTSSKKVITVDYFSFLEKDYRAITTLAKRYVRISCGYKSLIDEMDQMLERNYVPPPTPQQLQPPNSISSSSNSNNLNLSNLVQNNDRISNASGNSGNTTTTTTASNSPISQNDAVLSALLSYLEGVTKNMKQQPSSSIDQFTTPLTNFEANAYENYQATAATNPSSYRDLF